MEHRQPSKLELVLMIASSLIGMGAMVWAEMSPAQRELAVMTFRARLRTVTHRLARGAGQQAMGDELAGLPNAARLGYGMAYRLARLRDRL